MEAEKRLEKIKALIKLGVSVENAMQYAGGGFSEEEKAELAHCEFQHKTDKTRQEKEYENSKLNKNHVVSVRIDDILKENIDRFREEHYPSMSLGAFIGYLVSIGLEEEEIRIKEKEIRNAARLKKVSEESIEVDKPTKVAEKSQVIRNNAFSGSTVIKQK